VAVPVVAAVPPSTEVEAISVCVKNKAGVQIDAMMRMIIAAVRTDPKLNESFTKNLKDSFHLKDHLEIYLFISHFSCCSYASKVTAAAREREMIKSHRSIFFLCMLCDLGCGKSSVE
jgi:hypothetical protein